MVPQRFDFRTSQVKPTKVTGGGEVKIVDSKVSPVDPISAAIVKLKPGRADCASFTGIQMLMSGSITSAETDE